jgi:hypothetical protein
MKGGQRRSPTDSAMKQRRGTWPRIHCAALLLLGSVLNAGAFKDEFLVLTEPKFIGNQVHFTITGEADAVYVIETSEDSILWTPVVTNYDRTITRLVSLDRSPHASYYRGWRRRLPVFSAALASRTSIDFMGNNLTVDSFDSSDPVYSTNGLYDPTKRKANGDVATIDGSVQVGNARINGQIRTGVKGAFSFGVFGFAGPVGWAGPGLFSNEWYRKDFRFVIPDVPPPYTSGLALLPGSGTNAWVLASGDYYVPGNLALNNQAMLVTGCARLLVQGDFNMGGALSELKIARGASLQLFVGGPNASLSRVTILDSFASCSTFQCYGLAGNSRLTWSGNTSFVGTIYAPGATVKFGNGGTSIYDFLGACAAGALVLDGHLNFHFDENLAVRGPQR